MPGKYDSVLPKYMDTKDQNSDNGESLRILMNGKDMTDKNKTEISLHMTRMKQYLGDKRREKKMDKQEGARNSHMIKNQLSLGEVGKRRYTHG